MRHGENREKVEFIYFRINHNPTAEEMKKMKVQKRLLSVPSDVPVQLAIRADIKKLLREEGENLESRGLFYLNKDEDKN